MNGSVDLGRKGVMRLLADRVLVPGPVAFADYSQGSIIGGQVRNKIRDGQLNNQLVASVSFGNPMRREFDTKAFSEERFGHREGRHSEVPRVHMKMGLYPKRGGDEE